MAIYGAILFAALTIIFLSIGGLSGFLLLSPPVEPLMDLARLVWPKNDLPNSPTIAVIALITINALLGAILFVGVGSFLKFIINFKEFDFSKKGDHEE